MELPPRFDLPARYPIHKLAAKLRRSSPIRRWLDTNQELREDSAMKLFQAMQQKECGWMDRAVAYHLLGAIDLTRTEREHAAGLLVEALRQPDVEQISSARFFGALSRAFCFWWLLCSALALAWHSNPPDEGGVMCVGLISTPFVLVFQERRWKYMTQRIVATTLATVGNPACIEALWRQVHPFRKEGAAAREAQEALKAVLPQVTEEWYGHLPPGTDAALTDLASSSDIDMALAALNALGQAGSGRSAKAVENLAKRARSNRVREHAAAVLPTLLARRENEKSASMLLRPSAPGRTDELVRPVYSGDPDTTHLLRASQSESASPSTEDR